jgi:hypothetical protein
VRVLFLTSYGKGIAVQSERSEAKAHFLCPDGMNEDPVAGNSPSMHGYCRRPTRRRVVRVSHEFCSERYGPWRWRAGSASPASGNPR